MKLSNKELTKSLKALARYNALAAVERDKIAEHCSAVYGVMPGDVDNDEFIDSCDGGCGASNGMSAYEFDASMRRCMEKHNFENA